MAKRRPVNGSSNTVNRLEELSKKYTQRTENASAAEEDIISGIGAMNELKEGLMSGKFSSAKIGYDVAQAEERIEELYSRMEPIEQRRMNVASKAYQSGLSTALRPSNLSRDINAMSMSAGMVGQASILAKYSTHDLEGMKASASEQLLRTSSNILSAAENNPNNPALKGMIGGLGGQINDAAAIQAAMMLQRRSGTDIRSRYLNTMERTASLKGGLEAQDLANDVAAGKFGSRAEVETTLRSNVDQIERFRGAQEKASGDPAKFERFQRAIDKLTASAEMAAKTLKEIDRQGGGGGGSGFLSRMTSPGMMAGLNLVGQGLQTVGEMAHMYGVELPQRQRLNQTSFASMGNMQADDMMGAAAGNAASIRRFTRGYGAMQEANASAQNWSKFGTAAIGVGQVIGGVATTLLGAATSGYGVGIPIAIGGLDIMRRGFKNIINYSEGAAEAGAQAANAERARQDAMSKVGDEQMQSYLNYTKSLGTNTVGSGSRRVGTFAIMNSQGVVDNLAGLGVSPERAAQLTGAGISSLGSGFKTNMISRGAELRRGGYMSEESYMGNVGTLQNFGSSGSASQNIEEILKNAIANGMDASKNIAQMVQLTGSLASRSAGAGIDTVGGSQRVVSNIMDSLAGQGIDPNARAAAAANTADWMGKTTSDTSYSIGTIARFASSRKLAGNDAVSRALLSTLRPEQIQEVASGRGGAAKFGLEDIFYDKDGKALPGKLDQLTNPAIDQMAFEGSGGGMGEEYRSVLLKNMRGEELSPAERQRMKRISALKGVNFESISKQGMTGAGSAGAINTTPGGDVGAVESMNASEARAGATQQQDARLNTSLETLSKSMERMVSELNFKEINASIKKAADEYSVPAKDLARAAEALNAAASQLVSSGSSKR